MGSGAILTVLTMVTAEFVKESVRSRLLPSGVNGRDKTKLA
jgi:hypothetical protein